MLVLLALGSTGAGVDEGVALPLHILTARRPVVRFPVDAQALGGGASVVKLEVLAIRNPSRAQFSIKVYLAREPAPGSEALRSLVGALGVYPADQPGKYALDVTAAHRRLETECPPGAGLSLEVELVPMRGSLGPDLQVELADPIWTRPE